MSCSKKAPKGMRDLFPKEKRILDYLFDNMKKCVKSFGYEPYDGPMCEELDLYRAKSGQELINEQVYSFTDRGGREMAIRPEMTPTVARMVSQIYREVALPLRWFSCPNLLRYENPQRGRLREHWQFNCDIFGAQEEFSLIEVFSILVFIMKNFNATEEHYRIFLNDRKIVQEMLETKLKLDAEQSLKVVKLLDRSKKMKSDDLDKEIFSLFGGEKEKVAFLKNYLSLKDFSGLLSFLKKENFSSELFKRIESLKEKLSFLFPANLISYDPSIVRGLDYYTGFVFEIFDLNPVNARAICGGGAYGELLKIFGESELQGVGFGLGDVTLRNFLEGHHLLPDFEKNEVEFFVAALDEGENISLKLAKLSNDLREKKVSLLYWPTVVKFKKLFSLAQKSSSKMALFMGESEEKKKVVLVKKLATQDQREFLLNDVEGIFSFARE